MLVRRLISLIAIAMSLFHLYTGAFSSLDTMLQRSVHLGLALVLVFLTYPKGRYKKEGTVLSQGKQSAKPKRTLSLIDVCLAVAAVVVTGYIILNYHYIVSRVTYVTPLKRLDVICGITAVLLVFEGVRRTVGWPLAILGIVFVAYALFGSHLPGLLGHPGFSLNYLIDLMYLSTNGIYGDTTGVSATYIALFILFGVFLSQAGVGRLFSNLAHAVTARLKSGPAAAAVVSSALVGTVSGSAAANVYTTGIFTIPMMKRAGYQPSFAGAVEAAASCAGQFTPPVLGAAAFIVSELTGIPYIRICGATILPAVLYYIMLFSTLHLRACKLDLKPATSETTTDIKKNLYQDGHLIIPLGVLVTLMVMGYTPMRAAFAATVLTVIVSLVRWNRRLTLPGILEALEKGARNVLPIAMACATAGIVMGVITVTGLGFKFISLVMSIAGSSVFIALLVVAATTLILGMGMPTVGAYTLVAALAAPVLLQMGLPIMTAHLFIFYFAAISAITPPVALASYAGANIAEAPMMETAFTATRVGLVGFIIPFYFALDPSILLVGSIWSIMLSFGFFALGLFSLSAALEGWFLNPLTAQERVLLGLSGICTIYPHVASRLVGGAAAVAIISLRLLVARRTQEDRGQLVGR